MRTVSAFLFSSLLFSLAIAQDSKQATSRPAQPATSVSDEKQAATTPNSMGLVVGHAVIARDIDENGPVDAGTEFTLDAKRVYCITQIKGAETPVQIEHRWFLDDKLVFSLPLPIKSVNWRTQSYITLFPSRVGNWKVVVVLLPKEEVLTTLSFTVK